MPENPLLSGRGEAGLRPKQWAWMGMAMGMKTAKQGMNQGMKTEKMGMAMGMSQKSNSAGFIAKMKPESWSVNGFLLAVSMPFAVSFESR